MPTIPRRHRGTRIAGPRPASALVAILAALAVLAGCTAGGGSTPSAASSTSGSVTDAIDLSTLNPPADLRAITGPRTAELAPKPIVPVAGPGPALPVTVTDAQGTKVTVTDVSRILAIDLPGTLARTVFELGLGEQVIGRDISTSFAEAADLPLVTGTGHELNAEALLDLAPTVVLTDTSLGPWDVIQQLRSSGIPVVIVDSHRTMDNVGALTTSVAKALGVPKRGTVLADRITSEIAQVRGQIDDLAPSQVTDRLRMVFLYVRGQAGVYYMFGRDSGADALIDALDGYDVSTEIDWNGMKPVTDEAIIAAQPDLILMMSGGLKSVGGVDGLLTKMPALANTPAGTNRRIIDMSDTQILSFGPRTAEVLRALAAAVYAPSTAAERS